MSATKGSGPDEANDRPAKKNTDNTANFIVNKPAIGVFPKRRDTVIAEVLAGLLKGENWTGMDAVFDANTTRLASSIHILRKHGWPIEDVDKEVGTKDGRVSVISVYSLPRAATRLAYENGAKEFCESVKEARAKLRQHAPKASAKAAKLNAARAVAKFDPHQGNLFSDGSHG
jgi:hypothetical protein